jgi:predicted ferric reductase
MGAALSVIALVVTSVWRQLLRLSYEWWHAAHAVLAVVAVGGALAHVYFVDEYVSSIWKQILWGLMSAAFAALLAWVRVGKPRGLRRRPWRLGRVGAERGQTTTLALDHPTASSFGSTRASSRGSYSAARRSR